MGDKKKAYRRNGVQEYIVWQMFENKLDWFVLKDDDYQLLEPDADNILRSQIFPGLWLAIEVLLQGNMPEVLAGLQQGLNSAGHQAFVQSLQK